MKFIVLALFFVAATCDPTPLSAGQAALVRGSWNQVKHNEVDILYAIFEANPDIQARFPQFSGKDLKSLKSTASFAIHAGRIVGFVSEIIALIEGESNVPASKFLINDLAAAHKNRGITKVQFNKFRVSLVNYLQNHVAWSDNVSAAWTGALDDAYFYLFSALDGNPL